jgi:hypothetical protein
VLVEYKDGTGSTKQFVACSEGSIVKRASHKQNPGWDEHNTSVENEQAIAAWVADNTHSIYGPPEDRMNKNGIMELLEKQATVGARTDLGRMLREYCFKTTHFRKDSFVSTTEADFGFGEKKAPDPPSSNGFSFGGPSSSSNSSSRGSTSHTSFSG